MCCVRENSERKTSRALARLLAVVITLILTLLAVEIAARLFLAPPSYLSNMPFDPELGYSPPPDFNLPGRADTRGTFDYRTSSLGFRGPELPNSDEPAPGGVTRLMFLGDSFLEGWGVREESLMPFSCEHALRERGVEAESYNVSAKGIGTAQELLLFRRHYREVQPDIVVLSFYPGNDVVDNTPELVGRTSISSGAYVRPFLVADGEGGLEIVWLNPVRSFFRRHSRAFAWIEHALVPCVGTGEAAPPEGVLLDPKERLAGGLLPRPWLELFREPEPGDPWDAGWRRTEDLLRAFRTEVEEVGARFVLAVIPQEFQVQSDALLRDMEARIEGSGQPSIHEQLDWNLPERRLARFAADEDIRVVLLLDGLRERTRGEAFSQYQRGGHLNWRGHELAGELVTEAVLGLLAGGPREPSALATDGPVDLLALRCGDEGWFDFGHDPYPELLGHGWKYWSGGQGDRMPGWLMTRTARITLPHREGELVLQGWLPPQAVFPYTLHLRAGQIDVGPVPAIEGPGPFELRCSVGSPEAGSGGCLQLSIWTESGFSMPRLSAARHGLFLTAVGIR